MALLFLNDGLTIINRLNYSSVVGSYTNKSWGGVTFLKQTINIMRGTSLTINILVTDDDGAPYELTSTDIIRFCVKRDPHDNTPVIEKNLTLANYNEGVYTLQFNPSDTENLEIGRYFYDCGLQVGAEYFMIIEFSQFNIKQNVSKRAESGDPVIDEG